MENQILDQDNNFFKIGKSKSPRKKKKEKVTSNIIAHRNCVA